VAEGSSLWKGRKPIVVLTRGFIQDHALDAIDPALTASQRANAALYFVDAEGLSGDSRYSLAAGGFPDALRSSTIDQDFARIAGAEYLAGDTGGFAANSNDPSEALERVGRESSSYYLLGYQPRKAVEGSRHKLRVVIHRPGVTVRFRKSYETRPAVDRTRADGKRKEATATDPVLWTGVDHAQIPVHVATSLQRVGKTRLTAIVEIDVSNVASPADGAPAVLDLALLGAMRDGPERFRSAEKLTLTKEGSGPNVITLTRPVELGTGVAQLRVLVREPGKGGAGTAAVRLMVPAPDTPYLATLMAIELGSSEAADSTGKPRPVARRQFEPRGRLLLQYEVQGPVERDGPPATLLGSFVFRRAGGPTLSQGDPAPLSAEPGSFPARVLAVPLDGLADGAYEILIRVEDRSSGDVLEAREGFVVAR
jgi:hypothetical protein